MKEMICTVCPVGCRLQVDDSSLTYIKVSGNRCARGPKYAVKELTDPSRIITSTIKVINGNRVVVSCKSSSEIKKELIFEVMHIINQTTVVAPIGVGDVLIEDILDTGIDMVATSDVRLIDNPIICYCSNVTKNEIISALDNGAKDISDIKASTGACTKGECKTKNPTGKCCSPQINKLIDEHNK